MFEISTRSTDWFKREFVEAVVNAGYKERIPNFLWSSQKVLTLFSDLRQELSKWNLQTIHRGEVLVPSNGYLLLRESLPYNYTHEIIPFLWDCWPGSWSVLKETLRLLRVRLCFITSRQVLDMLQQELPNIQFVYVPEAVNPRHFQKGKDLKDRPNQLFEIGRKHSEYHAVLSKYFKNEGALIDGWVEDYSGTLSQTQVTVCFPRCDTHPEMAGEIETLTERYWESMFSRCLMLGRAPKELINIIGYNPVVEVAWKNPEEQLLKILSHIEDYQPLVDKNYQMAQKWGSWDKRIPTIVEAIEKLTFSR